MLAFVVPRIDSDSPVFLLPSTTLDTSFLSSHYIRLSNAFLSNSNEGGDLPNSSLLRADGNP